MSTSLAIIIGALVGLGFGAALVWGVTSRRASAASAERDTALLEAEHARARSQSTEAERDEARAEAASVRDEAARLSAELAAAEADRDARVEEMAKKQAELNERFKEIAAEVSQSTRAAFMKEFRDLSDQQTNRAGKTVGELVEPMRERLKELHEHVSNADTARAEDTAKVSQSVSQLAAETVGLRQILRDSKMRGNWGEQHLRNVIEAAGLTRGVDYIEQAKIGDPSGEGTRIPDVVVKVPGGTSVVIDAKTPHDAYDRAVQATDEAQQQKALKDHARALSARAKELGDRDYTRWVEGSPDFVLMYVPTDPMLDVAMDVEGAVWSDAWHRHRVLITTPGLLIAFLRTVALAWQRQDMANNAEEIAKLGDELYSRLRKYLEHVDKMGRGLRSAVDGYNASVGSFERMVLPGARKFRELGSVSGADELDDPTRVELDVRDVTASGGGSGVGFLSDENDG